MVFGGRKFKKWKEQDRTRLGNIYLQSTGDASLMENLLNNETRGECRKQVREFMLKAYELGYFSKGTSELMKDMKKRKQLEMRRRAAFMAQQNRLRHQHHY